MKRKGFTLIELLISLLIFALVMLSLYFAFSSGTFGFSNIEENTAVFQSASNVLGRLNLDLRNSFPYTADDSKFTGEENKISFLTVAGKDFAQAAYSLEGNNLSRLLKINKDALNEKKEITPAVIANNIKEIHFTYLYLESGNNNLKEKDSWQGADKIPAAVKISLTTSGKINKTFTRTVYLPIV